METGKVFALTRRISLCAFFLALILWADIAQGELLPPDRYGRSAWLKPPFRVLFNVAGEHAVSDTDINGNNVPDMVEDIATQLQVAHHIFCNIFGFPDPLDSPRYSNLKYIDVRVFSASRLSGAHGLAFDASSPAADPEDLQARSLIIYILRDLDPKRNVTPAHEYFHQIQNGATYFKNSWYYEGMARWAEDALVIRAPVSADMQDLEESLRDEAWLDVLYKSGYGAARLLWIPLAEAVNEDTNLPRDDPILNMTYTDGSPVLSDFRFAGARFMRSLLIRLGQADQQAFVEQGYQSWSTQNRHDPANNGYIIEAILEELGSTDVLSPLCRLPAMPLGQLHP